MPKFDNQYYFVCSSQDEQTPFMTPDMDTAVRPFMSSALPAGQKPLIFHNGALELQRERGIRPMDTPPDMLFHGTDVLVKSEVREKLLEYNIPNLSMYPAIYIDHKDTWHEDYWYLTFVELFDCWDRKHSEYDPEPSPMRGAHEIYSYSLNDELLEKTPLEERRLFKMGKTMDGMVVVHSSIASLFQGTGADLVPITDYGVSYP